MLVKRTECLFTFLIDCRLLHVPNWKRTCRRNGQHPIHHCLCSRCIVLVLARMTMAQPTNWPSLQRQTSPLLHHLVHHHHLVLLLLLQIHRQVLLWRDQLRIRFVTNRYRTAPTTTKTTTAIVVRWSVLRLARIRSLSRRRCISIRSADRGSSTRRTSMSRATSAPLCRGSPSAWKRSPGANESWSENRPRNFYIACCAGSSSYNEIQWCERF